jgi:hypothetical protein
MLCVSSYSKVGAMEQRHTAGSMVNFKSEGCEGQEPLDRGVLVNSSNTSIAPITCPITYKYRVLIPVIYTGSTGTPGDFVVASGSSLVLPGAAADTRGQHSTLHYTGGSTVRYAMQGQQRGAQERRREGGTRERGTGRRKSLGLLVGRQQELG